MCNTCIASRSYDVDCRPQLSQQEPAYFLRSAVICMYGQQSNKPYANIVIITFTMGTLGYDLLKCRNTALTSSPETFTTNGSNEDCKPQIFSKNGPSRINPLPLCNMTLTSSPKPTPRMDLELQTHILRIRR